MTTKTSDIENQCHSAFVQPYIEIEGQVEAQGTAGMLATEWRLAFLAIDLTV